MSPGASPDKPDAPARPHIRLRLREALCLIGLAILLGTAVGYLIAVHTSMSIAARVLASDMIVGLPGTWVAIIVLRRLARIEATQANQLDAELIGYNRGYMDRLKQEHHH